MKKERKVAIVGAGFVGSSAAYALLIEGVASEIAIIDVNKEKAEGEVMDLEHGMQFVPSCTITAGDNPKLCKDAEIVVVCAGANQKKGETRMDLAKKNAEIFKKLIPKITKHNKECILLIVANPLDVLTYIALKYSKLSPNKVFGTGTALDTARFRFMLGKNYGVSPTSVHAFILGEHGDSEFPVWSSANIAGININSVKGYNKKKNEEIFKKTKNAAYEIIAKKGATYYAIGLVITKIVKAILEDKNEVIPVSCMLKNYYGINDVCLSIPAVINKHGIKEQLILPLSKDEVKKLKKSASIIKEYIKSVK